jgi:hypothetical protein
MSNLKTHTITNNNPWRYFTLEHGNYRWRKTCVDSYITPFGEMQDDNWYIAHLMTKKHIEVQYDEATRDTVRASLASETKKNEIAEKHRRNNLKLGIENANYTNFNAFLTDVDGRKLHFSESMKWKPFNLGSKSKEMSLNDARDEVAKCKWAISSTVQAVEI